MAMLLYFSAGWLSLGWIESKGTSESQDSVTSYAFNAQSELAANRGKQWLNQCTWIPQLSYKSIQHKPKKGKCTAVVHNNIDNTLAPHTNVNYNVRLMPLLSMVMSITWVVNHMSGWSPDKYCTNQCQGEVACVSVTMLGWNKPATRDL